MSKFWSECIQTPEELYASRELRFREDNEADWLPAMRAQNGMRVLELGCAGGLLHRLKAALPGIEATGIDLDENHIAFARQKTEQLGLDCRFEVGNALALPFAENSFDLCYSHTVIEHVPAQPFLREQRRVLAPGGRAAVLSVRSNLCLHSENWRPPSGEEQELLDKLWAGVDMGVDREHGVAQHEPGVSGIPRALEEAGFSRVDVRMLSLMRYAPDSADVPPELAERQINETRLSTLESVRKALRRNPGGLTQPELERLATLIHARYDARLAQYRRGEKQWDLATSAVLVVSGTKEG